MKFDLNLFALDDQVPQSLYAASAPRRTARGREEDQVFVLFTQQGDQPLVGKALSAWQAEAVEVFYKTPGSVTSGMRAVIEWLNRTLLVENSKLPEAALKKTLEVEIGVVHRGVLFIGQAGCSRTVLISTDEQTDFMDRDANQLGLGVQATPRIAFFQKTLKAGDVAVVANELPNELVVELVSPAIYPIRNTFKNKVAIESPVSLIQFMPGEGRVLKGQLTAEEIEGEAIGVEEVSEIEEAEPEPVIKTAPIEVEDRPEPVIEVSNSLAQDLFNLPVAPTLPPDRLMNEAEHKASEETQGVIARDPSTQPTQNVLIRKNIQPEIAVEKPVPAPQEEVEEASEESAKLPKKRLADNPELQKMKKDAFTGVAKSVGWLKRIENKAGRAISHKVGAVSADEAADGGLPAAAKLIIAILTPLFIVALAAVIFLTQSHADDVKYLTSQAKVYYHNAQQVSDPAQQRVAWQEALVWIRQASAVSADPELETMRIHGESALDAMDGAVRLSFMRSFDPTPFPDLEIRKIIVLNYDVYLLDANAGQVLHFGKKGNLYEHDADFRCGPGSYDNITVGKLVSVSEIQINNPARAPIVAIDKDGATLYCSIGNTPKAAQLAAPDGGFGEIVMMTVDSGRMMILDPERNAIWIYRGLATQFDRAADSYFEDMPIDLSQAVEIAVNRDELFILHADGHSSHYVASNITGLIDGQERLPYSDLRADTPRMDFLNLHFGRLAYSPPPDPSIYYLDAKGAELYQFSLKLNLNRVLRSGSVQGALPGGEVSAFSVSSNQMVFLAFNNQLFHAVLP